jgi:hypothetical protein
LTFNFATCELIGMLGGSHAYSIVAQQGFVRL